MALSFAARLLRRFGVKAPDAEILPPAGQEMAVRPEPKWDLNASVEERADTFASLFLNAAPRDLRDARMGQFREQ